MHAPRTQGGCWGEALHRVRWARGGALQPRRRATTSGPGGHLASTVAPSPAAHGTAPAEWSHGILLRRGGRAALRKPQARPCLPACLPTCLPAYQLPNPSHPSRLSHRRLLTDALRTDMGFSGWVVSDCGAVTNIATKHHYLPNATYAAAAAIAAGVDIFCDPEAQASRAATPCTPACNPMHSSLQLCYLVITPHISCDPEAQASRAATPCTPGCNPMHSGLQLWYLVITPHRPWRSYPRPWPWVCCQAAYSTQRSTACCYSSSN